MGDTARSKPLLVWVFQLLLTCTFISAVCMQWNGRLSTYEIASFDNPIIPEITVVTRLDHFAVHPDTGDVYVGAVNYLYRLSRNLVQAANVSTATCDREDCRNYNKILALVGDRLITCGSEFKEDDSSRQCQSRKGDFVVEGVYRERNDVVAFRKRTTASIVAPGPGGVSDPRLYVAVTYNEENAYQRIKPIARRLLNPTGSGFLFIPDDNFVSFNRAYLYSNSKFLINYVSVFVWNRFTYFAIYQRQRLRGDQVPYVSKLARVCHDIDDVESYTEILIECRGPGGLFSLVQAAHVGPAGLYLSESLSLDADDQVLYAVFAKNQGTEATSDIPIADSALCVYKMSVIEDAFTEAVRECLSGGSPPQYLEGASCGTGTVPDQYICDAKGKYQYASGTQPEVGTSVVRLPGYLASSIITSVDLNHTVAFIGTSEGQLLKVHIESDTVARWYESVTLDGNAVMGDTMLNETTDELFVLAEQKLIKMRVENCGQYTTCDACIGTDAGSDGDPYCGWCTLERKCTRYNDCPSQDVSARWLAYNNAQCIVVSKVTPHNSLPITLTNQQVTLTVEQLPDLLAGQQYVCRFGDQFTVEATKLQGNTLKCITPPTNNLPAITSGDHVTVLLNIKFSETGVDFVDIDFSFYECDTHKTCVHCASSGWSCNWCIFQNKCTHDNSTCSQVNKIIITGENSQGTAMQGQDACPQLQTQNGEVLIPNDIIREIIVNAVNLPNPSQITRYQCSLNIEGADQSVDATRDGSTLTCNLKSFTYTASEQELNVTLTVQWIDMNNNMHTLDDIHGYTVTLYKCEVLLPDCSRCVSEETTRAELQCVWCTDTCVVSDSAVCSGDTVVTLDNMRNCPYPVLQEVYPLFGPDEGNTIITVMATNLGRRYSDVREVTVGGQVCDLDGLERYYQTGSSVSCFTRPSYDLAPQLLQVSIIGADGAVQLSQGDVSFQYKDPVLRDFNPKIGPMSGGTFVTISGESLDTGRSIQIFIGSMPCLFQRSQVNDKTITCLTSSSNQLGSWLVYLQFDGAVRTSQVKFIYGEDPVVETIKPSTSILAGGRQLQVSGSGFSIIQRSQIIITVRESQQEFTGKCTIESDEVMMCTSPKIDLPSLVLSLTSSTNISTGFILDGVTALRTWCSGEQKFCTALEYFQDPVYYPFHDTSRYAYEDGIGLKDGHTLFIFGERLDLAITKNEIIVYIGRDNCTIDSFDEKALSCKLPQTQPEAGDNLGRNTSRNLPIVRIFHGENLVFDIGYLRYPGMSYTVLIVCLVCAAVILFFVILAVVLYKKSKAAERVVVERRTELVTMKMEKTEELIAASGIFDSKQET